MLSIFNKSKDPEGVANQSTATTSSTTPVSDVTTVEGPLTQQASPASGWTAWSSSLTSYLPAYPGQRPKLLTATPPASPTISQGSAQPSPASTPSTASSAASWIAGLSGTATPVLQFTAPPAPARMFATCLDEHKWFKHCPHCLYIVKVVEVGTRPLHTRWIKWAGGKPADTKQSQPSADPTPPSPVEEEDDASFACGLDETEECGPSVSNIETITVFQCQRSGCQGLGRLCTTCEDGLAVAATRPLTGRDVIVAGSGKKIKFDGKKCALCKQKDAKEQDFRAERCLRGIKQLLAPLFSSIQHGSTTPEYAQLFEKLVNSCPAASYIARLLLEWLLLLPTDAFKHDWMTSHDAPSLSKCVNTLVTLFTRHPDPVFLFHEACTQLLTSMREIVTHGIADSACVPNWINSTPKSWKEVWLLELGDLMTYVNTMKPRIERWPIAAIQCAPVVLQIRPNEASVSKESHTQEGEEEHGHVSLRKHGSNINGVDVAATLGVVMDAGDYVDVAMGGKDVLQAVLSGPPGLVASAAQSLQGLQAGTSMFADSFTVASTSMKVTDNVSMAAVLYAADGFAKVTGSVAAGSALGLGGLIYVGISPTVTAIKGLDWILPEDGAGGLARVAGYTGSAVGVVGSGTAVAHAALAAGNATALASAVEGISVVGAAAGGGMTAGMTMVAAVPAGLALLAAGSIYAGVRLGQHIATTRTLSVAAFRGVRDSEIAAHNAGISNAIVQQIRLPGMKIPEVPSWVENFLLAPQTQVPEVKLCSHCSKASVFSEKTAGNKTNRAMLICHRCEGIVCACRLCDVGMAKCNLEWCNLCWAPADESAARSAAACTLEAASLWPEVPEVLHAVQGTKEGFRGWAVFDSIGHEMSRTIPTMPWAKKKKSIVTS